MILLPNARDKAATIINSEEYTWPDMPLAKMRHIWPLNCCTPQQNTDSSRTCFSSRPSWIGQGSGALIHCVMFVPQKPAQATIPYMASTPHHVQTRERSGC